MKQLKIVLLLLLMVIGCNPKKKEKNSKDNSRQDTLEVRHVKLDTTTRKDTLGFNLLQNGVEPMPLPIIDGIPEKEGFDISSETDSELLIEPKIMDEPQDSIIIPLADAPLEDFPFNIAGKIEVEFGGGKVYTCSCQFVAKYILITAAHCIKLGNEEAKRITFFLKYNKGSYEKSYAIEDMVYWSSYTNVGSYDDYAFLKVGENKEVPNYWLGIASAPTSRRTNSMGYPGNIKGGEVLQNIKGYTDGRIPYGSYYYMTENPFGAGSSGGAWFNEDGYVVGINSFTTSDTQNTMFSSYLGKDDLVFRLFEEAKNRFE